MVICLERDADLHMAQLMPLPLTVSCFSKIQIGFTFWYRLTWVVPDKGPLNGCVCVCVPCCRHWQYIYYLAAVFTWIKLVLTNQQIIILLPLVLRHCLLGVRKSIWPIKIKWWRVGIIICLERGADYLPILLPSQNLISSCRIKVQNCLCGTGLPRMSWKEAIKLVFVLYSHLYCVCVAGWARCWANWPGRLACS